MQNKNKNSSKCTYGALQNQIFSAYLSAPAIINLFISTLLIKVLLVGALFLFPENQANASALLNASELIRQTNEERMHQSLPLLEENSVLNRAAYNKANDIITHGYFAHTTPEGKPFYLWIQEIGYEYKSAGENLAIFFTREEDVVHAWMRSPSHRSNVLDPYYTEIGMAVASGTYQGKETNVVVQLFGEPLKERVLSAQVEYPSVKTSSAAPLFTIINYTLNGLLIACAGIFLALIIRKRQASVRSSLLESGCP